MIVTGSIKMKSSLFELEKSNCSKDPLSQSMHCCGSIKMKRCLCKIKDGSICYDSTYHQSWDENISTLLWIVLSNVKLITEHFVWPNMSADIRDWRKKISSMPEKQDIQKHLQVYPAHLMQHSLIDLVRPLHWICQIFTLFSRYTYVLS